MAESVSLLDEKVDRRMTALEEKMDRGFDEVKAMIKFSYAWEAVRVMSVASAERPNREREHRKTVCAA